MQIYLVVITPFVFVDGKPEFSKNLTYMNGHFVAGNADHLTIVNELRMNKVKTERQVAESGSHGRIVEVWLKEFDAGEDE